MTTCLFSLLNHLQPTFALYLSCTAERECNYAHLTTMPWKLTETHGCLLCRVRGIWYQRIRRYDDDELILSMQADEEYEL